MNPDKTLIVVLLDASGSMMSLTSDTLGGFNSFVRAQREAPGEALLTLVTFAEAHRFVYKAKPLADVPVLSRDAYKLL